MPTRFYLQSSGSAGVSPSYGTSGASWNDTVGAARLPMNPAKQNTSLTLRSRAHTNTSGSHDVLLAQFISPPLAAQWIAGTVFGYISCRESNTDADMYMQFTVRLVSSTGANKKILKSPQTSGGSEFPASLASSARSRTMPRAGIMDLEGVEVAAGDRLVVEIGYRAESTHGTSRTGYIEVGDPNSASDFTTNNQVTTDRNGWVEFSDTIVLDGEDDDRIFTVATPGTVNTSGSGLAWTDPGNVAADDNTDAVSATTSGISTEWQAVHNLDLTNFGFSIPSANTIQGIILSCKVRTGSGSNNLGRLLDFRPLNSGGLAGTLQNGPLESFGGNSYSNTAGGGNENLMGLSATPAMINGSTFGMRVRFAAYNTFITSSAVRVDVIQIVIVHTPPPNAEPEITVEPEVTYGAGSRLGPENTPAVMTFTAEDEDEDDLTYTVHTATGQGGSLITSGDCDSGVEEQVNIPASGLSEGTVTLYLTVDDGLATVETSFTVEVDASAPTLSAIEVEPELVTKG